MVCALSGSKGRGGDKGACQSVMHSLNGCAGLSLFAGALWLLNLGSYYFIMRSELDPSLCLAVPQDEGAASALKPCEPRISSLILKTEKSDGYSDDEPKGRVVSSSGKVLCLDWNGEFTWYTQRAIDNSSRRLWDELHFTEDKTRFGVFGFCLVANPDTSSVDMDYCDPSSPAQSWIIETPGMPTDPAHPVA